jgi:hypothetical protein
MLHLENRRPPLACIVSVVTWDDGPVHARD